LKYINELRNFAWGKIYILTCMEQLKKIPFLFFCIVVMGWHPDGAYSQNGEDLTDQDLIFRRMTDLPLFLEQANTAYHFHLADDEDPDSYQNSSYIPNSYMDIIKNPFYETLGYTLSFKDTMIIDPIFMPVVFTGKVLPKKIPLPSAAYIPYEPHQAEYPKLDIDLPFEKQVADQKIRNKAYLYITDKRPDLVRYTTKDLPDEIEHPEHLESNIFKDLFKVDNNPNFTEVTGPEKFDPGRIYWIWKGEHTLQFSGNDFSDNWYKGGKKNINIYSDQIFKAEYKKDKVVFNSELRWKLSLFINPGDTLQKRRQIGEDLIRSYSDFGIKAFSKWSYSTNLEIKTQFFNNYKDDNSPKIAAFIAPLYVNMGILGMKYALEKNNINNNKHKKIKVTADISPLSVKYTLVANDSIDASRYGVTEGRHRTDLGSSINSTLEYSFNRNISFRSRFKFFTSYEKVEIESENEMNVALNRYFSTRFLFYLRFDDSEGIKKGDWGYFQRSEVFSFGINFKW